MAVAKNPFDIDTGKTLPTGHSGNTGYAPANKVAQKPSPVPTMVPYDPIRVKDAILESRAQGFSDEDTIRGAGRYGATEGQVREALTALGSSAAGDVSGVWDGYRDMGWAPTKPAPGEAAGSGAEGSGAAGSGVAGWTPTDWNVTENQTVQGQTRGLLEENSPLLQRVHQQALEQANNTGLRNSSMAVGAATGAVMDRALEFAKPDAATYAASGQFNANSRNQAASDFAGASNTDKLQTKGILSQEMMQGRDIASREGMQAKDITSREGMQTQELGSREGMQAKDITSREGMLAQELGSREGMQAKDITSREGMLAQELGSRSTLQAGQIAADKARTEYQGNLQTALQTADFAGREALTRLDGTVKASLAEVEAKFKTTMQTSQSAAMLYADTIKSIAQVMGNKDLDAGAMQNAVNQLMTSARNGIELIARVGEIPGLDALLAGLQPNPVPPPAPPTDPNVDASGAFIPPQDYATGGP